MIAKVLTCAEAAVGTFAGCTAAATIELIHQRVLQGYLDFPRQAHDHRLAAYLSID